LTIDVFGSTWGLGDVDCTDVVWREKSRSRRARKCPKCVVVGLSLR
jgi:hypothetical protein